MAGQQQELQTWRFPGERVQAEVERPSKIQLGDFMKEDVWQTVRKMKPKQIQVGIDYSSSNSSGRSEEEFCLSHEDHESWKQNCAWR